MTMVSFIFQLLSSACELASKVILEGGVNRWLSQFSDDTFKNQSYVGGADDELKYAFTLALGARHLSSMPSIEAHELEYTSKVVMETKRAATSGGCG